MRQLYPYHQQLLARFGGTHETNWSETGLLFHSHAMAAVVLVRPTFESRGLQQKTSALPRHQKTITGTYFMMNCRGLRCVTGPVPVVGAWGTAIGVADVVVPVCGVLLFSEKNDVVVAQGAAAAETPT